MDATLSPVALAHHAALQIYTDAVILTIARWILT
jgi:hypothetical protein